MEHPNRGGEPQVYSFHHTNWTFEFTVLPFVIKNAPTLFQRLVDTALAPVLGHNVLAYLDDIVIFANDYDTLCLRLKQVLALLRKAGFYLRIDKSALVQSSVELLGHVIDEGGIHIAPRKVDLISSTKAPTNNRALHSFIGLIGYLRPFINNFSDKITVLQTHLQNTKRSTWFWSDETDEAFTTNKEEVRKALHLGYIKDDGPFIIDTDASLIGIGAALIQVQDGRDVVIEYASCKLNKTQQN